MGRVNYSVSKKYLIIFFIVVFLFIISFLFRNFNLVGFQDWDVKYAKAQANIISILDYHQFPIWNPYHCGGISQIGDSTNDYLNPLFVFNLIFGPNIGYRVIFLIYLIIGLYSFYLLGRYLKLSFFASVFSSVLFNFSGLFFLTFASGMPEFLPLTLLPLLLLYYFEALNTYSLKALIKTSIVLSLIFFGGFHYLPLLIIFLTVLTFIQIIINKNLRLIFVLTVLFAIFFPTSSIKTVSVAEQTKKYPRFIYEKTSGYSIKSLGYSLLSSDQTNEGFLKLGNHNMSYNINENGIYIGFIPFVLLIIGIFFSKSRHKSIMLTVFFIFLYLSFGFYINPSLYRLLHSFPILNNLRVAQRYHYFFMIPLAFFSGLGLDRLFGKKNIIAYGILIFVTFNLIFVNSKILSQAFSLPLIKLNKTKVFTQSAGKLYYDKNGFTDNLTYYSSFSSEYPHLLANYGTVGHCYEEGRIFKRNTSYFELDGYSGEYYLINSYGRVEMLSWSPNKMIFNINIAGRGTLVINQNFNNGWRVKSDNINNKPKVFDYDKLIGVQLYPGKQKIILYYLPTSFIIGATITTLSIIIIMIFLFIRRYDDSKIFSPAVKTKSR